MKFVLLVLVMVFSAQELLYAQEEKAKYYSTEKEAYYNAIKYTPFKPTPVEEVLSFNLPYLIISEIKDYIPFKDIYYFSPEKEEEHARQYEENFSGYKFEGTSGIRKVDILKKGELDGREAIIYSDNIYDYPEGGIWIALNDKSLNQWQKYYTGLSRCEPLFLKWESSLPLFKDTGKLQIEAAYLRKIPSDGIPGHEYELVKDGIVVVFDLDQVIIDTDGDGLTDIVEQKMNLSYLQKDTDGDGIHDYIDSNPRMNLKNSEKTLIYEAILRNKGIPLSDSKVSFSGLKKKDDVLSSDATDVYLIVSDSKDVQSVSFTNQRIIILTEEEYEKNMNLYHSTFPQYYLTPLFKVDNMKNSYLLEVHQFGGGAEYLIKKGWSSWKIKLVSMVME